jgi:hypothetical protein
VDDHAKCFAFSKIFVAVLTASQLIGAAHAASVVINQSSDGDIVVSQTIYTDQYGAVTIDKNWWTGSTVSDPKYLVDGTLKLQESGILTQPELVGGKYSGDSAFIGVFIGHSGQVNKIETDSGSAIKTCVGIYNEGTIGRVRTDYSDNPVIEEAALVINGSVDTSYFGMAVGEPNALQNSRYGIIAGSVLIGQSASVTTHANGHELLNAGSIYGNVVVERTGSHEILNRKPKEIDAVGLITGAIINSRGGALTVYNEGKILGGIKNDGSGSVRILNRNFIAGKALTANSLYNVTLSAIKEKSLKYQSMNNSETDILAETVPSIEIQGKITLSGLLLNYGSVKAQTAQIANLSQASAASAVAVEKSLILSGASDAMQGSVTAETVIVSQGASLRTGSLSVGSGQANLKAAQSLTVLGVLTAEGPVTVEEDTVIAAVSGGFIVAAGSSSVTIRGTLNAEGGIVLTANPGADSAGFAAASESFAVAGGSVTASGLLDINKPGARLSVTEGGAVQAAGLTLTAGSLSVSDGLLLLSDPASPFTVGRDGTLAVQGDVTLTDALPAAALSEEEAGASGSAAQLLSLQSAATVSGSVSAANLTVAGNGAVLTFANGADAVFSGDLLVNAGKLVIENGANVTLTGPSAEIAVAGGARLEVGDMVLVSAGAMPDTASGLRANAAEITVAGELDAQSLIVNRPDSHVTFKSGAWGYIKSLNLQTGTLAVEPGALLEMGEPSSDRRAALGIDAANEAVLDHNDNKPLVVNQAKVAVGSVDLTKLNAGDVYFASDSHFVIDTRNDIGGVGHLHSDHEGSVLTVDSGAKLTVVSAARGATLLRRALRHRIQSPPTGIRRFGS